MKNLNFMQPVIILLFVILGCSGGERKTEIHKSGRLQYVEYLRFGPAGTHGSNGWYVEQREIDVNGHSWKSEAIDLKNITCEANPNETLEALKCRSYETGKTVVYIIRMKGDQPELAKASELEFVKGSDSGEWADNGHWLIFRNYFFNIETSEKREIKNLPDEPDKYFVAASPDLETIIFREFCYSTNFDEAGNVVNEAEHETQCKKFDAHQKNGIEAFWLIEAKTGKMKMLELKIKDYPFAENPHEYLPATWLKEFKSRLIWEKDKDGKDRLVYPK